MKSRNYALLILIFPALLFSQDVALQQFAVGFNEPVDIKHAGDPRLFVVEQDGMIKVLDIFGNTNAIPFLDIDARVNSSGSERRFTWLSVRSKLRN
jgi:hypothetical protein